MSSLSYLLCAEPADKTTAFRSFMAKAQGLLPPVVFTGNQ